MLKKLFETSRKWNVNVFAIASLLTFGVLTLFSESILSIAAHEYVHMTGEGSNPQAVCFDLDRKTEVQAYVLDAGNQSEDAEKIEESFAKYVDASITIGLFMLASTFFLLALNY